MKIFFTVLSIAVLLSFSSCDLLNNEPELPPITTEGKGTFGCLVNGKLFLNDAPWGYGSGIRAELQTYPDTLGMIIYASNSSTNHTLVIFIYDVPTLQVGKIYNLTDSIFSVDYIDYSNTISCRYQNVISGNVKLLKFDIVNPQHMIVAGTFGFRESSLNCKDTIAVIEGRFDISDVTYQ